MSVMQLEINEVTRDITPDDRTSFVEKDVNVDTVRLALPVGFSDLTIGSGAAMRVMYIRPGESQVRAATASLTESNGLFHFFDWHLTAADLEKEGPLQMAVCLVGIGEDGETKTSDWNTKIYSIQIHGGLHTDRGDEEDPDIDASVAEQIAAMNQAIVELRNKAAQNGKDAILLRIDSSRGTVFKNSQVSTVMHVTIYYGSLKIDDSATLRAAFGPTAHLEWEWQRIDDESVYGTIVSTDARLLNDGFDFIVSPDDVDVKVTFRCSLIAD